MGTGNNYKNNCIDNDSTLLLKMRVRGHLREWFNDYFGDVKLKHNEDGSYTLTGKLQDSAAFYGLILTLRDSGVELLSLKVKKLAPQNKGSWE